MKEKLLPHEWTAVLCFMAILLYLIVKTQFHSYDKPHVGEVHWLVPEYFVITISGEVEKPGRYHIHRGGTVKDAIELALPTQNANLSKMDLDKKIRKGQKIRVPHKPKRGPRASPISPQPNH